MTILHPEIKVRLRRAILNLSAGQSTTFQAPGVAPHLLLREAKEFSTARGLWIVAKPAGSGVALTHYGARVGRLHPELNTLAPGQSITFRIPPEQHRRMRTFATQRARKLGVRFRCSLVGNEFTVTRVDTPRDPGG